MSISSSDDLEVTNVVPEMGDRPFELARVAARTADDKQAIEPVILDLRELLVVVDAFVVCAGRNGRHVRSLVEDIEEGVKEAGGLGPIRIEGLQDGNWVLMDYGTVVIHVFAEETRSFYDLEHLWSNAPRVSWAS